ncbi:hypothetical protein [Syntrophomonas sp.]|uniref:hypothetical protein n=1 Tax=Syntrophomonas sp. TaxID=2053627 RepID=UPI0034598DEC
MKALEFKAENRPQDAREMLSLLPRGVVRSNASSWPSHAAKKAEKPAKATAPLPQTASAASGIDMARTVLMPGDGPGADALPVTEPMRQDEYGTKTTTDSGLGNANSSNYN